MFNNKTLPLFSFGKIVQKNQLNQILAVFVYILDPSGWMVYSGSKRLAEQPDKNVSSMSYFSVTAFEEYVKRCSEKGGIYTYSLIGCKSLLKHEFGYYDGINLSNTLKENVIQVGGLTTWRHIQRDFFILVQDEKVSDFEIKLQLVSLFREGRIFYLTQFSDNILIQCLYTLVLNHHCGDLESSYQELLKLVDAKDEDEQVKWQKLQDLFSQSQQFDSPDIFRQVLEHALEEMKRDFDEYQSLISALIIID